jgi:hypothetical protein
MLLATGGLIGAFILVFVWQSGLPHGAAEAVVYSYGMIPAVPFGSASSRPASPGCRPGRR